MRPALFLAGAFLSASLSAGGNSPAVRISEVLTRNLSSVPVGGKCYDWIELQNTSDSAVSLSGYGLASKTDSLALFMLPPLQLAPHACFLVYATDRTLAGKTTTGFNLNGNGILLLMAPGGVVADELSFGECPTDVSKGRAPADSVRTGWSYFSSPTPGTRNSTPFSRIAGVPQSNRDSGMYSDTLLVRLQSDDVIRYTLDGSEPTAKSPVFPDSLAVRKTTVLRAASFAADAVRSPVATFTYLVRENCALDAVCIASDPDGLFSASRGILARGPGASSEFPYKGANFWKPWKRRAEFQLIPLSGRCASRPCELSVFGGYTRGYPKKSVKVKFKDAYGAGKLKYRVFPNRMFKKYDALVLRTGGQDSNKAMFRDDVVSTLADTVLDVMASRPCVLYFNGAYHGVYFLREKISEEFVASHYGVSTKNIDIIQGNCTVNCGSADDWNALKSYVRSHDLRKEECFKYVSDRVDLQNYADYVIAEIFCGNADTGNIRFFRSPEIDGKWRWILYDTDMSMRSGAPKGAFFYLNPAGNGSGKAFSTALINALMRNPGFRKLFVERLEFQMKHVWNTERVLSVIDRYASMVGPEVARNDKRWNVSRNWNASVEDMRRFVRGRKAYLKKEFATSAELRSIIALDSETLSRCFD